MSAFFLVILITVCVALFANAFAKANKDPSNPHRVEINGEYYTVPSAPSSQDIKSCLGCLARPFSFVVVLAIFYWIGSVSPQLALIIYAPFLGWFIYLIIMNFLKEEEEHPD